MDKKIVGIAVAAVIVIGVGVSVWYFVLLPMNPPEKWGLVLAASNDFHGDKDMSIPNSGFELDPYDPSPWEPNVSSGTSWNIDTTESHSGQNSLKINSSNPAGDSEVYLQAPIMITPGLEYILRGWIKTSNVIGFATIGLWWLNSGAPPSPVNIVSKVYSTPGLNGTNDWTLLTLSAVAPPTATFVTPILRLKGTGVAWFDDISFFGVFQTLVTDSDAYPAQALQAYYILKGNGYDDNHIILMLYHTNDSVIDIYGTGANDLTNATVDVENDNVNKSRFSSEVLSLASLADINDDVLIYVVAHGSRTGDIASIHFESDGSSMNETEFSTLINQFNCSRMTILVDGCYTGNFISSLNAPGESRISISAASNITAWYWTSSNASHYAGSWFFHPFWERLKTGVSIGSAHQYAIGTIPTTVGPFANTTVDDIQSPILQDNALDANTYTFL